MPLHVCQFCHEIHTSSVVYDYDPKRIGATAKHADVSASNRQESKIFQALGYSMPAEYRCDDGALFSAFALS